MCVLTQSPTYGRIYAIIIAEGKPARFDRVKGKTIGIWSLLPISAFNIHMLLILFIICQHLSYTYPQV
jgi:hypothetical protein